MSLSNPGAERAVIAGLCQYGQEALADISDILNEDCFTVTNNQFLYSVIEKVLQNQPKVDISSIVASAEALSLNKHICENKKDIEYLRSVYNFPIHLDNVRPHAKILAKLQFARKAQSIHKKAHSDLENITGNESIDEIISISEKPIFDLSLSLENQDDGPELMGKGLEELLNHLLENPVDMIGIPTPWPRYNEYIGGGVRPGVALVASRPGGGKSTLGKECGLHIAGKMNIPTLVIDTEMLKADQTFRALAGLVGVSVRDIETGKFAGKKEEVFEAKKYIEGIPWYHVKVGGKPFVEILSIIRRWMFKTVGFDENGKLNKCFLIYDYFKLMDKETLKEMQEYQAMGFQIAELSDFCMKYEVPCLAFVQVNRDGITKETSDIISQSDRLLWLCTSCAVFREKTEQEIVEEGDIAGNRKLFFLKTRFGAPMKTGDGINFKMDGEFARITELKTKSETLRDKVKHSAGFGMTLNEDSEIIL